MKKSLVIVMVLFATLLLSDAKESNDASLYSKGEFIRLRKGVSIYGGQLTFHSFPKEFEGRKVTLRMAGTSTPVEFKVKKAGIVRLIVSSQAVKKLISDGWVEVGKVAITGEDGDPLLPKVAILEKRLEVGEYSIPSEGNFGVRLLKK